MKRFFNYIFETLLVFILLVSALFYTSAEVINEHKNRAIYVVFDNSGSMYRSGANGKNENLAWSQATYAMEVFSSMMNFEHGDFMKVFPMHEVSTNGDKGSDRTSKILIQSKEDIKQIHNMFTPKPLGTPYTQVNTAAKELADLLQSKKVQEGWLVVLTDGDFDTDVPGAGLKNDLIKKALMHEQMYVQYLAMGKDVKHIPDGDEKQHFYSQHASDSAAVTNELAIISNRIFKRNEYPNYKKGKPLEFDIPLSKCIVFAQGSNVKVNSLKNKEGGEVKKVSESQVSVSSTNGAGLTDYVTKTPVKDQSLKGVVVSFANSQAIMEGQYVLDIEGADTIQVYYEPNVTFGLQMLRNGKICESDTLAGGEYQVKVGFMNRLTGEIISDSKLLGTPKYQLMVNGKPCKVNGKKSAQIADITANGDELSIDASVTYLNNYQDALHLDYKICNLDLRVDAKKKLHLKELANIDEAIMVHATKNNQALSEEQWKQGKVKVHAFDEEGKPYAIDWDVRLGDQISSWVVTPKYKDGDMFATGSGKMKVVVDLSTKIDDKSYGQSKQVQTNIIDDRNVVDYIKKYWKKILGILLLLILIAGYLPPIKKRFSRKMLKKPTIDCQSQQAGVASKQVNGSFEIDPVSKFAPFIPETGRLVYMKAPKKSVELKAIGGGQMEIINVEKYAGKENITFNGMSIPAGSTRYTMKHMTTIVVTTPETIYSCTPSIGKKKKKNRSRKKSTSAKRGRR